ncbi:substrate-binding domain-containing protein [Microbulbifer taiwanensis]|uniref:substrate-binding domain-containing protein n=1 Tax=Microbulbifer taiwanensis TaxID=986746 RepID=UPI003617600F
MLRLACHLLLALLLFLAGPGRAEEERYVFVVVNRDSVDALDQKALRAIFSMRLQNWEDGSKVRVFVLPDNDATHRQFVREILRMYPHQLRRSWDRAIYSGMGEAPEVVSSEEEMTRRLLNNPGAIGYLSEDPRDERLYTVAINQ